MLKNQYLLALVLAAPLFISCSEIDDELELTYNGKYVLPFNINIEDGDNPQTRVVFNGAAALGGGSARNLLWTENDDVAFYCSTFPEGKKTLKYSTHVDGPTTYMYGDEALPFAANSTYTIKALYPYNRLKVIGSSLEADLPSVQNGTVNMVAATTVKAIECPPDQTSNTSWNAYNITDYSACLLYASPFGGITTGSDGKPKSDVTFSFAPRVHGIDVILDAPKSGNISINEVDVELGTYVNKTFSPHTSFYLAGTLQDIESQNPTVKTDGNQSTKIQLKFNETTISGTDRMVARMYSVRKGIPSGAFMKISVKITKVNGDASKARTLYRIIQLNSETDKAITHFYLGQLPIDSEEYVDLGLSVNWATRNLGAATSTETGDFYAWAADKSKSPFTFSTYTSLPTWNTTKLGKTASGGINQYFQPEGHGVTGQDINGSMYDIAYTSLGGGKWHMPTQSQWQELIDYCTWQWDGSKHGYKVTSNKAGYEDKSIFIPAAGYMDNTTAKEESSAFYWTSTFDEETTLANIKSFAFKASGTDPITKRCDELYTRHWGMLIRPVRNK